MSRAHWQRTLAIALTASAIIIACQNCTLVLPLNLPPKAVLTADRTTVYKGESVHVTLNGTTQSRKTVKVLMPRQTIP